MKRPSVGTAFRFAFAPLQMWEFAAFLDQWRMLLRVVGQIYHRCGLLKSPDRGLEVGVRGILREATATWLEKCGPSLAEGWSRGRFKGLLQAAIAGEQFMADQALLILIGWTIMAWIAVSLAWVALWFLAGSAALAATPGPGGPGGGDLARAVMGDIFAFISGSATTLGTGLGTIAFAIGLGATVVSVFAFIWTAIIMAAAYVDSPDRYAQQYSFTFLIGRSAFAFAMLAPVTVSGYGLGPQIIGWLGMQGSDKASSTWSQMVGTMNATVLCQAAAGAAGAGACPLVGPPMISEADLHTSVLEVVAAEACMAAINADPSRSITKDGYEQVKYEVSTGGTEMHYNYYKSGFLVKTGGCGSVTFPAPTTTGVTSVASGTASQIVKAEQTAFANLQKSVNAQMTAMVAADVSCLTNPGLPGSSCTIDPSTLADWIGQYRTDITTGVTAAIANVNKTATAQLAAAATQQGWIASMNWAFQLSNLQGSFQSAADSIPHVTAPDVPATEKAVSTAKGLFTSSFFRTGSAMATTVLSFGQAGINAVSQPLSAIGTAAGNLTDLDHIFPQINSMAPIAGLSQLGRYTAWIALSLKGTETVAKKFLGGAVGEVGKKTSGVGIAVGILADGAAFLIDALWIPLFLIGCALGWLVPALPFLRMLLAVMNWVLAFIETVLLSQLMFGQMISAEPGGLFPSAAKPLIWNTVALMVRPLLTLGGFIIGLMACSEMIGILNSVYVTMMRATTGTQILGFFVNVAIYFGVAYVIVNTTTKTAEYLPNAAYRWLGANAGGERDDAHAVGSTILAWVQKVRSPVKAAK